MEWYIMKASVTAFFHWACFQSSSMWHRSVLHSLLLLNVSLCMYWYITHFQFSSVQSLSRVRLFCDPMDCSTPGFPVHHQLAELAQTHVHWVGDATQPSHSLSPPSPAFNLSQDQGLFQWVCSLHQVAKVLFINAYSKSKNLPTSTKDPTCLN